MATILIVDTEATTSKIMQDVLESEGHWVITALDGAEALACTRLMRVDLILCDTQLDDIPGIEICRRLRMHPSTNKIPIIFMSDHPIACPAEENLATAFVYKPIVVQSLFETIQWYLPISTRIGRSAPAVKHEDRRMAASP